MLEYPCLTDRNFIQSRLQVRIPKFLACILSQPHMRKVVSDALKIRCCYPILSYACMNKLMDRKSAILQAHRDRCTNASLLFVNGWAQIRKFDFEMKYTMYFSFIVYKMLKTVRFNGNQCNNAKVVILSVQQPMKLSFRWASEFSVKGFLGPKQLKT